jgi:radical SAM superfamily enzyme YgiQ (UPF0313 family)
MKWKLIYPKWRKLERQTPFHLPPHGPVVFAAEVPPEIDLVFVDENVQELRLDDEPDLVCLSMMLTSQLPRGFEIADAYRERGIPVIAGGIATMLHSDEVARHVSSVFLGEVEGRLGRVVEDLKSGRLEPIYNYLLNFPDIRLVGPARRSILDRERYAYRGVKMVDLVHCSRGCRFKCFPCCTPYLGGCQFRPRPLDRVIEEIAGIYNNRLFIVDNSLAQNTKWEEELFTALAPLNKKWVSHPIEDNDHLLDLAYKAGCWYVYQAVFDTSDFIRKRIQRYHDHGIGIEATVILGTDDHDEDAIKRLVDFLIEVKLDLAEFTIMTPFAHTPIRAQLEKEGRIFDYDHKNYTCDRVVFEPKRMSARKLQELYYYAWDTFYKELPQEVKMGALFQKVMRREMEDGSWVRPPRGERRGRGKAL